jgi:hypothetical protein
MPPPGQVANTPTTLDHTAVSEYQGYRDVGAGYESQGVGISSGDMYGRGRETVIFIRILDYYI